MKELSIEEKAKAYDDLLVKLQKAKVDNNVCDDRYCCVIDDIVPELKESEDERIRKALIKFHKSTIDIDGIKGDDVLAWLEKQGKNNMGISETTKQKLENNLHEALEKETPESCNEFLEKQGEQKPAWSEKDNINCKRLLYFLNGGNLMQDHKIELFIWMESLKERMQPQSKQEWSEEDETKIKSIIALLKSPSLCAMGGNKGIVDESIKYLNSLKNKVQPQPKQECSEDGWTMQDEEELQIALDALVKAGQHSSAKWLKNVCLRPQNTWKPSDEQMEALDGICSYIRNKADWEISQDTIHQLYSLSEQLKKLKG